MARKLGWIHSVVQIPKARKWARIEKNNNTHIKKKQKKTNKQI
jgi:hypothetical protein